MKSRHLIAPAILSAMLAVSGVALAAGAGGGSSNGPGGAGSGTGADATTPAQGADNNAATAATGTSNTTHKSTHKSHTTKKHTATKPMSDTTNTPGADASSDTKGQ